MGRKRGWFLAIGIALGLTVIHWPVIVADTILSHDDDVLLYPLLRLDSIAEYFDHLTSGKAVDVQPVRDLSYLLDTWLKKALPFWSYHLGNLLVWLCSCFFYWKILDRVLESRMARDVSAVLLAFHPAIALSISWISGRKHLLSGLFIGIATFFLMELASDKGRRRVWYGIGIPLAYGLAVFSQPIGLLWPLWALLYPWVLRRERGRSADAESSTRIGVWLLPVFVIGAVCLKLNWDYYNGPYVAQALVQKMGHSFDPVSALTALGRYACNLLFPFGVSIVHERGSAYDLIGLFSLPVVTWVLFKLLSGERLLLWGAFMAFPLATVVETQVNIYVSDTYLVIPILGAAILIASATVALARRRRVPLWLGLFVLVVFAHQSRTVSHAFLDDEGLWDWAASVEKGPFVLSQQVIYQIRKGNDEKALYLAQFFANWLPNHVLAGRTLGGAVLKYRGWTNEQKLEYLEKHLLQDPWYVYFLSGLHAKMGNFAKAWEYARVLPPFAMAFESQAESISADVAEICRRARGSECEKIEDEFRKAAAARAQPWRHEVHLSRSKELGGISF